MLSNLEAAIVHYPLVASSEATVLSAVEQMSNQSRQGIDGDNTPLNCVVIESDELKVLGILTQQDVMRLVTQQQPIAKLTLRQFWQQRSPSDIPIISESDLKDLRNINAAIAYFESSQITHLAIVDAQDLLIGVLQYESLKRLRDNTIHQATASLLASQQKIHERIAKAEPLKDVLGDLLLTMETYLRGSSCSITLCRDGRLGEVIAPSLPPEYARIVSEMGLPIAEGVGSCGTAAFRRELVVVTDIDSDPIWQNDKDFVLCYGLQACSSMPIFASDRTLLGVFGIYYREQKAPQYQELDWIAQATNIAGIAIERDRAVQALQQLNHELENRVQVRTQELQEREQFLQTVLDTFPLSVFWKDVNSVYLGCNQNFLNDAGLQTVAEIIGKTDREMPWGETEADLYRADDQEVIESQTAKLGIVETLHHANGQTIWLETNKFPLRNLQGDVIGVLGTYQDISDRKAVELALQASEVKFRRITESVPGMIYRYVLHPDGRDELVYVSPQVQQIFELTPEVVLQDMSCLWERVHPEDIPIAQSAIQESAVSLQPFFIEERLLLSGNRMKWIHSSSQPNRQENGDITWDGVVMDISDRKNAELALQESQAQFLRMTESVPGMIFRYVLHPDGRDEAVYVSPQVQQIYELTPEAVCQDISCLWAKVHTDDVPMMQRYIEISAVSLHPFLVEVRILLLGERMKWVQISAQPDRQENGDVIWDGVVIDISDRKAVEKALMLKQSHLAALINNIPHIAWIKDEQSRFIAVNTPFVQACGVSAEELVGKTDFDIWSADLAQAYRDDDAEVLQSGQRKVVVEKITRADGTLGWLETTKTPFRDDQLNIAGTVGIAADITDRKRMEIELAASEAKFRHLVEGGQDLIWAIDTQYHFTYLSPQFTTLFGWDVSEWIGRPSNEAVYPEDRGWLIEQQTLETVNFGMHNLEFRHCHRDRPYVWVRASAKAITDSTGAVVGYQGVLSDISTLKQAELALKASERRYASLAAAAPVAIFRFDEPLNCVYVNERWSDLSGRPMESALGRGWMEGLHPEDSEQRLAEWTEYYANSNSEGLVIHGSEGRHLRPDGTTTWIYVQVAKEFDDDGNVVGYIGTLTDITDRKNAELALQQSLAQFRRMTESVPGMIYRYVLHPDGRDELVYASPQVQQIFELTPEAVIQDISCLWARFHPEDIPMIQSAIQNSAASLQPFFVETRLLLPNERVKWIQVSSQPDRQENSDVIWDGVVIDISDRKNAEQKLQELSERLELAIQSAQIGIWEFDFSNNRLFWDKRMLAIHGVSPEAFHGTYEDWSSRVHPDDLLQAQPDISREKAIYSTEFRIIRPDGTVRWVMSYSCKQRNDQGELVRAVGVNIDISDRKNTELVLKDLSDRLEFALKGANIGIWEYQINEGRLIWDERMFTLYGVSSEEFLGKYEDWLQRVHPDDLDWVQQAQQKAHQGDKECRAEFRIIRPDGTIRFIDSYAFNQYNAQGEIQKTIGLNIDISDRKQAELQLQRINEELIRATRLKDEFLANMSHELRTPLNAILGMTEILEEQIFGDLNDRQMQSLHTIENSSKHLLELINDILDVAKIEAGQIHLSCQPSNIEALCQSSLVFIKQQAFNKKIQLETEIPPNLPTINLDERRIRQVLINLLNNAVKFTPNGGKISLQVSYIQVLDNVVIAQGCPCDTIEMSVIDTGIGIAPDQIKRLFQPFVQVESALNRSYNGTGLGLALVKRLVELHGGEVRLTSELGVGSCFTIALPITPFCESSIVPESPLPSTTESILKIEDAPLILLAEDNEENINLFADYLSLKGYRLVIAHNGRMAIDLAQQIHPDLILMDIQMPEMDGLEAIQLMRQIPELANTPIITLTALAMSGDRDRCIAVGANDYLSKPVSLKQLVKKINGYLSLA